MIGGVVEEATRKGKVAGSNHTGRETRDFTRKKASRKRDFLIFGKIFLQAVGITEPPVEMHFHRKTPPVQYASVLVNLSLRIRHGLKDFL